MIPEIRHFYIGGLKYVAELGLPRDPHWHRDSRLWLRGKVCAATGWSVQLQVHHKRPFHLFPELEMDPDNWIALTECPAFEAHFEIGHFRNWKKWNPNVDADAAEHLAKMSLTWKAKGV